MIERRNRSLCETARTMLNFAKLPQHYWVKVVFTARFTQNRSFILRRFNITPYVTINKRKPDVKFFHILGCRCFIMNLKYSLSKFQSKADEIIFLGYSQHFVTYRVMNNRIRGIQETFNLTFDDYYQRNTCFHKI